MKKPVHPLIAEVPSRQSKVEMTIGIDLGDVWSHYCTLNEKGEAVDRGRFRTSPKGVEKWFTDLPPARVAIHIESSEIRHTVEARFWDNMERVSRNINEASQVYFEAFRNSEHAQGSKVFSEFSIRCFGVAKAELVSFARKEFDMLIVICREWLKKHGIRP